MKAYTVYVCKTCRYESRDAKEVKRCEAAHLGLTVEEMEKYKDLKNETDYMKFKVSCTRNEETIREFNNAVQKVLDFEKEHGIK